MNILILLFEVSDKIPSIEQLYISGIVWAVIVFAAAFFNRWIGLVFLLAALLFSTQTISDGLGADIINDVIHEMGDSYVKHWNYSIIFSVAIEIFAFVSGFTLKNFYLKRKEKLELE